MSRSVLIVEDEFVVRLELEQALTRAGWKTTCVGSVGRAVAALSTMRFDAALVDLNLGQESAYPVVDALVSEGIPFMILTGYATESVRPEHQHRTLSKPFRVDDLVGGLDQLAA